MAEHISSTSPESRVSMMKVILDNPSSPQSLEPILPPDFGPDYGAQEAFLEEVDRCIFLSLSAGGDISFTVVNTSFHREERPSGYKIGPSTYLFTASHLPRTRVLGFLPRFWLFLSPNNISGKIRTCAKLSSIQFLSCVKT